MTPGPETCSRPTPLVDTLVKPVVGSWGLLAARSAFLVSNRRNLDVGPSYTEQGDDG